MSDYATYTDEQLWVLITRDDHGAFTEVYNRYWRPLFMRAKSMLTDTALGQDAVQEVFISLWHRRKEVEIKYLKAYLYQAVRFQELKAIRNLQSDANFYDRLASISKDMLVNEPLAFKELEGILQRIIAAFPEDQRRIFSMSREEGLTYREIAEKMDISVKTVEKKVSRSLHLIRRGIDPSIPILITFLTITEYFPIA